MNKGWIIGCSIAGLLALGCAGLVAAVSFGVFGIFALTQPVVDASDQFLGLLGQDKIAEARASAAPHLCDQQDEASFAAAVKYVGLTDYASASWNSRKRNNQEGSVEGTVTTKDGRSVPVALRLGQHAGAWKVVGVRYRGIDLTEVPTAPDLRRMVTETLLEFNRAVQARNFTAFHAKISASWKRQISPRQLQSGFQEFIDNKIDIGPIQNVEPQLDAPSADPDAGVLAVAGAYPTRPARVRFTLKYVREGADWKLAGISVNVKDVDEGAQNGPKE